MLLEGALADFVTAHLLARGLTLLCAVQDGSHAAVLAADGDELVLVWVGERDGPARARIDRISLVLARGEPVRLDHEEALARLASPS
jgi:hypothetical protein